MYVFLMIVFGMLVAYLFMFEGKVPSGEAMLWGGIAMFMFALLGWALDASKKKKNK